MACVRKEARTISIDEGWPTSTQIEEEASLVVRPQFLRPGGTRYPSSSEQRPK